MEWRKRLSDIGREMDDVLKDERLRHEEKSKQYQRVIERQKEKLDRFENKMKRLRENYEGEIEEYKTEIANFKREMGKLNSESGQRKALKALTYQLIATRFELAETREALKRAEKGENEEGKNKENHINNVDETKRKSPSEEKEPDVPLYSKDMLYYAAEKGLRGLVQKILSPQQNYPDKLSEPLGNAMSKACVGGNVEVVKNLLQYGASVNAKMKEANTCPLHFACRYGRAEVVKILIDEGAEIDAMDSLGKTPLFHAAETNHPECVELLLFAGCDVSVRDVNGKSVEQISGDRALSTLRDHKMLFWNCCTRGNRVYVVKKLDLKKSHSTYSRLKVSCLNQKIPLAESLRTISRTYRYNQSHHEEALRLFKEALRLTNAYKLQVVSKDKATIHYNCARAAIRMHRNLLAVEHCTFAIDLDSSFFKAWKLRGESRHKLHDFKDAVNDLEQALKLSPADEKVFSMLEESRRARDMDHYTLFGVPAASSVPEIKKRYRKLCLKWHPDKNRKTKDDMHRAANMFRRIQDAYKILTEPCQRVLYDMAHKKTSSPSSSASMNGVSSSEQQENPVRHASSSSSEKRKMNMKYEEYRADDFDDDDDFDELDESLDYPLVEEDDIGDDLFGEAFGVDDPFNDVYDEDDDDDISHDGPETHSGGKDRMWKLFEEYERAYNNSPRATGGSSAKNVI